MLQALFSYVWVNMLVVKQQYMPWALYMIPRQQRQFYWFIQHLFPSLSVVLINTYREDIDLFVDGAILLSTEGTTQGDPLAMAMYGIQLAFYHSLKRYKLLMSLKLGMQMLQRLLGQQLTFDAGGTS